MKKNAKYTFLMLLMLACMSTGLSQSITIVYDAVAKPDAVKRYTPQRADDRINYRTSLCIANGQSKYSRDSLFVSRLTSQGTEYWYHKTVYKDYNRKLWLEGSGRYQDGYVLRKDLDTLQERSKRSQSWSITEEHKVIAGIDCIKSADGYKDIAWYAPSMPYPDGPQFGVFNLPGLVMEYETELFKWTAVSVHFGEKTIALPAGEWSRVPSAIERTYQEIMSLDRSESIVVDAETPLGVWIGFGE